MAKNKTRLSSKDLEKKFEETAFRISQERSDFLLPQIVDFVNDRKWLNLRPEYQRRLVWDKGKRSRFIESLLLNVPVPPVFLYEWELGRYEVMDGQQRLNSIVEFYENGLALSGLETWTELHGLRYRDLPTTLQRGLDRRRLSATVLLAERPSHGPPQHSDIRKLVFNRLNTGGQQLNDQELRNCLFESDFNKLLIRLSQEELFQRSWDIPLSQEHLDSDGYVREPLASNRLYRRMIDCEIVLRFFAFRRTSKVRGSVKSILDRCMEDRLSTSGEELESLAEDFRSRLSVAVKIFGNEVFRYTDDAGNLRLSLPLYDAVMVSIDRLWGKHDELPVRKERIIRALNELLKDEKTFEVVVGRPNTARAILDRIKRVQSAMESA